MLWCSGIEPPSLPRWRAQIPVSVQPWARVTGQRFQVGIMPNEHGFLTEPPRVVQQVGRDRLLGR